MKFQVLVLAVLLISIPAEAEQPVKFKKDIDQIMDTTAAIEVYDSVSFMDRLLGKSDAERTMDEIEKRWRDIESILSIYDERAEAYRLNEYGHIENASDELLYVLEQSLYYYNITGGAFDITVQPLLDLWSSGLWQKSREEQERTVRETMRLVGADRIIIKGRDISMPEGMKLTFGGIGKGYALDEAVKILKKHGTENALIRLGGQEYCRGINPDSGLPWRIGLTNPDNTSQQITIFAVSNASISTSGNYERYFNPDKSAHHIIDPRTGFSASPCISTTMIADNATAADALSTSVFVLGPDAGLRLVESLGNVEGLIIDNNRTLHRSSGLGKYEVH
jgi:thiamine biosynthesis lipoprotein